MRVVIALLVFGNLLLFAVASGWLAATPTEAGGADASTPPVSAVAQGLSPDRIQIVSRGEPPPLLTPVPTPVGCVEWPAIARSSARRIIDAGELAGLRITRAEVMPEAFVWRVLIPAGVSGSKSVADKKMAELKKLGIKNYTLIEDAGLYRFSVLLTEHGSESEATASLTNLRKKGVRSAQTVRHSLGEAQERLIVSGPPERLVMLKSVLPDQAAIDCPAPPIPAPESSLPSAKGLAAGHN